MQQDQSKYNNLKSTVYYIIFVLIFWKNKKDDLFPCSDMCSKCHDWPDTIRHPQADFSPNNLIIVQEYHTRNPLMLQNKNVRYLINPLLLPPLSTLTILLPLSYLQQYGIGRVFKDKIGASDNGSWRKHKVDKATCFSCHVHLFSLSLLSLSLVPLVSFLVIECRGGGSGRKWEGGQKGWCQEAAGFWGSQTSPICYFHLLVSYLGHSHGRENIKIDVEGKFKESRESWKQ